MRILSTVAIVFATNDAQFGIRLFEGSPGMNLKECNVGKYKSQFGGENYEAGEGQKLYSRRAIRGDYLGRKGLMGANGRARKIADQA